MSNVWHTNEADVTTGITPIVYYPSTSPDSGSWTIRETRRAQLISAYTTLGALSVAPTEPTMNVPDPKKTPCPKCDGVAITTKAGVDWTMDVTDHDVRYPEGKLTAKENGRIARMRICSQCGHVWATILAAVEK